jgi:AcrR family transcriptional regulator
VSSVESSSLDHVTWYATAVPKLWNETIEAHRRAVHDATLAAAAALVAEHGLRAVTMSQIADTTGIGRATLYKYFPDVEAILRAWHDRQLERHLELLAAARDQTRDARQRIQTVLESYALIRHDGGRHHAPDVAAMLHDDEHLVRAHTRLRDMIRDLLKQAVDAGAVRNDVPPDELAAYCVNALGAASGLASKAAVRRLVAVTLAGLRPAQ